MSLEHGPVTSIGKSAPGPDPRIRHRIQIGMFRSIRVDHTNCLQVIIKTHSFLVTFPTPEEGFLSNFDTWFVFWKREKIVLTWTLRSVEERGETGTNKKIHTCVVN